MTETSTLNFPVFYTCTVATADGRAIRDRLGCEFRRNPPRDSDLMSATVPI